MMNRLNPTLVLASDSDIWPPNWSQLVPDLIVGLFIGAIIGLALELIQRGVSRRDEKREAQRSWDRLQSSLRVLFEERPGPQIDKWVDEERLKAISDRVKDYPIQDWSRLLDDKALKALVRLEHDSARLLYWAQKLAEAIGPVVIEHRPASVPRIYLTERHREAERAIRARVLGLEISAARIHFEDQDLTESELLSWAENASQDDRLKDLLQRFKAALKSVNDDFKIIVEAFSAADRIRT